MSEENTAFTTEQILNHAQGNANAVALGVIAYLKDHHQSPGDFFAWLGQQITPNWESFKGHGAKEFARLAALNLVSFGGKLRSLSGDESRAEAVIEGWPSTEWLALLHITQSDTDSARGAFESIGTYLGLRFQWQREGDAIKITVSR
jgi:hypothetical protein